MAMYIWDDNDKRWELKRTNTTFARVKPASVIKAYMDAKGLSHKAAAKVIVGVLMHRVNTSTTVGVCDMSDHTDPFWHSYYLVRG